MNHSKYPSKWMPVTFAYWTLIFEQLQRTFICQILVWFQNDQIWYSI